jgi:hypothetical protein
MAPCMLHNTDLQLWGVSKNILKCLKHKFVSELSGSPTLEKL